MSVSTAEATIKIEPNLIDFRRVFEQEFAGMVVDEVEYDELVSVRETLIDTTRTSMTEDEKRFLLAIKQGQPDWALMPVADIDQLPAIQWKLINIRKMNKEKQKEALRKLQAVLDLNE